MNLSAYEIALISGGFGIIGTMLGAWLNHHLSIIRSHFDTRRLIGTRLREAFYPELFSLKFHPTTVTEVSNLLESAFIKHQIAVNEFRLFLTDKELTGFSKAWQNYYGYPETYQTPLDGPSFEKYHKANNFKGREEAIKNINAILAFAEPPKFKWYHYVFQKK